MQRDGGVLSFNKQKAQRTYLSGILGHICSTTDVFSDRLLGLGPQFAAVSDLMSNHQKLLISAIKIVAAVPNHAKCERSLLIPIGR
jgi:hypothetical protein